MKMDDGTIQLECIWNSLNYKYEACTKRFGDTDKYVDDLLILNNSKFNSEMRNIYAPELTLKQTTELDTILSYLDVLISICHGKFVTEVNDKGDNFNFNIVKLPIHVK